MTTNQYRLRLTSEPFNDHPTYLVGWSRPRLFGERTCLAVVAQHQPPLTWKTRRGAEAALAKMSPTWNWTFVIEPTEGAS